MLKIFDSLFQELNSTELTYCNWKGHCDVHQQLSGFGDIDIFVPLEQKIEFESVLKRNKFIKLKNFHTNHDFIEHYYGYDPDSSRFGHLHVYFKIVTGESNTKNYNLPIEQFIKENIDSSTLLPTINKEAGVSIFLTRYFIKIGSVYGLFQYFREKRKYVDEWNYLKFDGELKSLDALSLSEKDLKEMASLYAHNNFLSKLIASLTLKYQIREFRRKKVIQHQFFKILDLVKRIANKLFLKRKKTLSKGLIVAVCGLDGTGKSTLVKSLEYSFKENFSVKKFHLGRPSSSFLSFFIIPILKIRSVLINQNKGNITKGNHKRPSNIYAIRSVFLAYDRRKESLRALNYSKKGFIIICDRYPGLNVQKMDSPRLTYDEKRGSLYKFCQKLEDKIYNSISSADMILHLKVPLEIAQQRNRLREKVGKETDEELEERYEQNSDATFLGHNYVYFDATHSKDKVLKEVVSAIWEQVSLKP